MKWLMLAIAVVSAETGNSPKPVDFDTEVAPILSKAGCNAAACHGSAEGRGGLKLSLFGGDPASDFESIVRDREGRRLRFDEPADSLLLAKPTGVLDHEGGLRFDADSAHAELITRWISEGAERREQMELQSVVVSPSHFVTESAPQEFPLKVTARFQSKDGRSVERDVTRLAVYESADRAALDVQEDGLVRVKRRGRSVLVVRFLSEVLTVRVTVPLSDQQIKNTALQTNNWIDDHILRSLKQLRIPPGPQARDHELIRRLTLDLTGRLPTAKEAQAYAANDSPKKYEQLVDRLLASAAFNDYWCFRLMTLLRVGGSVRESQANGAYAGWIREQIENRRSLAEMTRELLLAVGDSHEVGPANFYRTASGPRKQAEFISESLMGVRLRCANCHNHPLDRWTQDDYHGLSALLANVESGRTIRLRKGREVIHPKTGKAAVPRIPGERFVTAEGDARVAFADWLTQTNNPFFARAFVNRVWKAMMGRGLVEPTDDIRDTNPASHPSLLAELQKRFMDGGARLRPLLRSIALSSAYRRSSQPTAENASDDRFYSRRLVKSLEAEVLVDAISDVSGVRERFEDRSETTRAVQLFNPRAPSKALDVLGRCGREDSCEIPAGGEAAGGLSARLHLLNGDLLNDKITSSSGFLKQLRKSGAVPDKVVEEFYWRALSRPPTEAERSYWMAEILKAKKPDDALEDFVWSLLSSAAFSKNH